MQQAPQEASQPDEQPAEEPEPKPLLELRDGLTDVVDTEESLAQVTSALASATGPLAIDAERASGYRYSNRAYLIQVRRVGAGTALIDPIAFASMEPLQTATADTEWILHAATQDLPCLREIGLRPASLFDTELAGRLLGFPRVGLATLVEELLGFRMRKEHSAADWSTRPLPAPWLDYAALDVEALVELRDDLSRRLVEAGKDAWARQEFEHLLDFEPAVRAEPWRRTSGSHRLRGRRALAAVRELWTTRDRIARTRDVAPGRILPDSAIVAATQAMPATVGELMSAPGFHGRGARRYARDWVAAIERARALPDDELPVRLPRSDGPPQARSWPDKDPVAAARLAAAKPAMAALSEELSVPGENLLTPDTMRRLLWRPPTDRDDLAGAVGQELARLGARPWQVEVTTDLLVEAIRAGEDA